MKLLFTILLFISTEAMANDICRFNETWEFTEALKEDGIRPLKKSKNHKRFTFLEKEMIHLTVTLQEWLAGVSRQEALQNFGDYYNGRQGSNAGEIVYYSIQGKTYALVHYWPGDNEYGGFYELRERAYRLIAKINDSFIECH